MAKNRIRTQYKNVAVLLRRLKHITTDYDVFVVVEESVELARSKAALNARKFIEVTDKALVSWEDWLNGDKVRATVLGYTNKPNGVYYKGYLDMENQPLSQIEKNILKKKEEEENEQ